MQREMCDMCALNTHGERDVLIGEPDGHSTRILASDRIRSPGEDAVEFIQDGNRGRRDEHLVRMAIEGDQDALETVFTQYRHHLYYTALRLCGNPEDAEDALQEIGRASCRERGEVAVDTVVK